MEKVLMPFRYAKSRRRRKSGVLKGPKKSLNPKDIEQLDQLQGLRKIELCPLTQRFVGCRVGENITSENPWIFIEKERIEDHLEFYEENSDFYPIWEDIKMMPDTKILIGTHHYIQDSKIEFYVCLTPAVQNLVLEAVEKDKKRLQEKILNSLNPKSRVWKSLGSEPQVDMEMTKNTRPLVAIEVEGCMPLLKQKIRFSLRNVENLRDGYIELLTTRSTILSIMRKRLDAGVQSSPQKIHQGVQVVMKSLCNKNLQCIVDYGQLELSSKAISNLKKFFLERMKQFCSILKLNFSLDLYHDDYTILRRTTRSLETMSNPTKIKSYQDVINCNKLKISCFSWNALISGIVAVAHAITPIFSIEKGKTNRDIEYETVFQAHLILIWHYKDNVKPKLYLHASRDVTTLSFCPYNANILVAGYNNGQIAVWDLEGKLDAAPSREFLTDIQQKNHILINVDTGWWKRPLGDNHVRPVLRSDLEDGHKATVTTIQWVPPSKYIAPQRVYKDCGDNEQHMQFITASCDGQKIFVWDLRIPDEPEGKGKKKFLRLSTKPDALLRDKSPLLALKKIFKPVCRLIIKHLNYPVTSLFLQRPVFSYQARNPDTLRDMDTLTYFNVSEKVDTFDYSSKLLFTTGIGTVHEATWEESEFDPKFYAVDEKCQIGKFPDIHDGPILICEANPHLQDAILTIGGSVFAIWYLSKIKVPLLWRKTKERYVTGMWSQLHPLAFLAVRTDTYYELWNIFERSNLPIRIFKYKGYKLTNFYKDASRSHARKKTCAISDSVGAFHLYTVPSEFIGCDFDVQQAQGFLEYLVLVKQTTEKVKENFRQKQVVEEVPEEPETETETKFQYKREESERSLVQKKDLLTKKMKWDLKLERNMRKVILDLKHIDLGALAENKTLLENIVNEDKAKKKDFKQKKAKQVAFFKKARGQMFSHECPKTRRSTFKCDTKIVKDAYFNQYVDMEAQIVERIRQEDYSIEFNWGHLLRRNKTRYRIEQHIF